MRVASRPTLLHRMGRALLALGAVSMVAGVAVHAENLDQGKSAARLFADSCVTCHRSPRGLAKGRFSLTLYLFLQQHYVSNSSAAKELTSYLEAADDGSGQRRSAAAKPSRATGAPKSALRPPAPVPAH